MAREACPDIPEPLCRMKRDAKHKPQVGGGWHPSFPDGCVRNSVTVSSARQLPVRAALRQNANACAFTLHRFYNLYYTRPGKKSQSAFCISFPARTPRLLWIFPAPRPPGTRTQGGAGRCVVRSPVSPSSGAGAPPSPPGGRLFSGVRYRSVMPLNKGDPACWRPAWGGVRLRGNGWWVRLIFGGWCRFAQDDTWGYRGVIRNLFGAKYSTVKPIDTAFSLPN